MNAHVERFNRTLRDEFVDYHESLLFEDTAEFNRKLGGYLVQYNILRPHHTHALNFQVRSPPCVPKVVDVYSDFDSPVLENPTQGR